MKYLKKGAALSRCGQYRYALWRDWPLEGMRRGRALFIGLNPSTADGQQDDATIRRCVGFARSWGCTGLVMLNAFAYRSRDWRKLLQSPDPIGPRNRAAFEFYRGRVDIIVAAWGAFPLMEERAPILVEWLADAPVWCLGWNKGGSPKHPLFVPKAAALQPFNFVS